MIKITLTQVGSVKAGGGADARRDPYNRFFPYLASHGVGFVSPTSQQYIYTPQGYYTSFVHNLTAPAVQTSKFYYRGFQLIDASGNSIPFVIRQFAATCTAKNNNPAWGDHWVSYYNATKFTNAPNDLLSCSVVQPGNTPGIISEVASAAANAQISGQRDFRRALATTDRIINNEPVIWTGPDATGNGPNAVVVPNAAASWDGEFVNTFTWLLDIDPVYRLTSINSGQPVILVALAVMNQFCETATSLTADNKILLDFVTSTALGGHPTSHLTVPFSLVNNSPVNGNGFVTSALKDTTITENFSWATLLQVSNDNTLRDDLIRSVI